MGVWKLGVFHTRTLESRWSCARSLAWCQIAVPLGFGSSVFAHKLVYYNETCPALNETAYCLILRHEWNIEIQHSFVVSIHSPFTVTNWSDKSLRSHDWSIRCAYKNFITWFAFISTNRLVLPAPMWNPPAENTSSHAGSINCAVEQKYGHPGLRKAVKYVKIANHNMKVWFYAKCTMETHNIED